MFNDVAFIVSRSNTLLKEVNSSDRGASAKRGWRRSATSSSVGWKEAEKGTQQTKTNATKSLKDGDASTASDDVPFGNMRRASKPLLMIEDRKRTQGDPQKPADDDDAEESRCSIS